MKKFLLLTSIFAAGLIICSCTKKETTEKSVETVTFFDLCKSNSVEEITQALNKGEDVNQKDQTGFTPIFYALTGGEPELAESSLVSLQEAFKNDDENKAYEEIQKLWNLKTNSQLFNLLLEKGADLTVKSPAGKSLFQYAALRCEDLAVLNKLIETADFSETIPLNQPESVFSFAVFLNQNPECIKALADHYKIDQMNSDGITPVMWACMYQKNPAVIDTLIELGGNINDKKHSGQYSPLDWAYKCNRSQEVCNHIKEIGGKSTKKKNNTVQNKDFSKLEAEKVFIGAATNEVELKRFLSEANRYRGNPAHLSEPEVLFTLLETKEEYDSVYEKYLQDDGSMDFNHNHRLFTYDEICEMLKVFKNAVLFGKDTTYLVMGASTKPHAFYNSNNQFCIQYGINSYRLLPNESYDPWAEAIDLTNLNERTSDYYYIINGEKKYYSSQFTEFYTEGFVFLYEVATGKIFADFSYSNSQE